MEKWGTSTCRWSRLRYRSSATGNSCCLRGDDSHRPYRGYSSIRYNRLYVSETEPSAGGAAAALAQLCVLPSRVCRETFSERSAVAPLTAARLALRSAVALAFMVIHSSGVRGRSEASFGFGTVISLHVW